MGLVLKENTYSTDNKKLVLVRLALVRIMNELSDGIRIERVRQGYICFISHSFQFIYGTYFQTYYQYEGCQVGSKHSNNLRYADESALLAGNEMELPELISKINEPVKQFGMKISIKKSKSMVVSNKPNSPKVKTAIRSIEKDGNRQ